MNIDELEAGPELDALIAEEVMGHDHAEIEGMDLCHWSCSICNPKHFSVSIAAAWEVVAKFKDYDWKLFSHGDGESFVIYKDGTHYSGDGASSPLAICRAALKAVNA